MGRTGMAMPTPTMSMKTATSTNQTPPRAGVVVRAGPDVSFMGADPIPGRLESRRVRTFLAACVYSRQLYALQRERRQLQVLKKCPAERGGTAGPSTALPFQGEDRTGAEQ